MKYVGIDVGTTSIKGAVLDVETASLGPIERVASPPPIANSDPLFYELDPLAVVDAVANVVNRLVQQVPDCAGVLFCGQMGGVVLADPDGSPRSNYISWLDRRLLQKHPDSDGTYFEEFSRRLATDWPERLGHEVRPGLPIPFLWCLKEQGQLIPGTVPVTLPDFVAANVCRAVPAVEWTQATGSLDVIERDWPTDLLRELQLDELQWPQLVDYRHRLGQWTVSGRQLDVHATIGDHQCALAGTLLQDEELSLNISTGSQVSRLSPSPVAVNFQVRPYFDGLFLRTITNLPAGRALNSLVNLVTELVPDGVEEDPWDEILAKAESTQQSDMVTNLAFFPSPVEGPGALTNLHEGNLTIGHLFRAAFQQMADYYETFALRVSPERDWKRLVYSGGLAQRANCLRTLIGDRLGESHRITTTTEDTLIGLLVLAHVVSGRSPDSVAASRCVGDHMSTE